MNTETASRNPSVRGDRRLSLRLPNSSRMSEKSFAYLLIIPVSLALIAIVVFPVVYTTWLSMHRVLLGRETSIFLGLDQYIRAFRDPLFWNGAKLTLIYTVATTTVTYLIAVAGALLLNESFRGRRLLMVLIILPWALSTYATAVLWRYIYSQQIGLLNAVLLRLDLIQEPMSWLTPGFAIVAVAIAHAWQMAPFAIYFLLASLQVIPPDLYRVARIDRLGALGRFRHVTFPYLRGALMAVALLTIMAAVRVFDVIYFITNGGPGNATMTMTFLVYLTTFRSYDIGYGSALSQLLLLIVLVVMVAYFAMLMAQRKEGRP